MAEREKERDSMDQIPFKPAHPGNYRRGRPWAIQYIVIHYTANDGDAAAIGAVSGLAATGLNQAFKLKDAIEGDADTL